MSFDENCLFCGIGRGEVPADIVVDDDLVVAFRDISPKAPTHVLLIPRQHVASAAELGEQHAEMLGRLFAVAAKVARDAGVAERGFRLVTNAGPGAGQSVNHLHFHLLGGRSLGWPPG
ncbi:MAG TPA: histidine triad nucleotide-binding protein [Candidatus Limnocylindria bacterium]|nr:histidine triad nucleotide-binding protein [Candidatus Limnocylindria bacterium]